MALVVGSVAGFGLLVDPLGYPLATALTFFTVAAALGARRYARLAVGSLVLALLIYLAFTRGLGIHLPPGVLEGIL